MIALIKNDGKEYYSPILVLFSNGWKSKVIVFDFEMKMLFSKIIGPKEDQRK